MIVKNFLFHRVSPVPDLNWSPVKPTHFERIIKYISLHYSIVNLEEFYLEAKFPKMKKPFASISFDDGYKDCIEYSAEILKKYNCHASFYVVTDCTDKNVPTWTYIIDFLFVNTKKLKLEIESTGFPEFLLQTEWKNNSERIEYSKKLKPFLKTIPDKKRENICSHVFSSFNDIELPKVMMSWDDISQLSTEGFNIGSHTRTHRILPQVEDDNLLLDELKHSFDRIREKTGKAPVSISYPCGYFDERVKDLSSGSGYKIGLTSGQRPYYHGKDNIFEIPRIELYNERWLKTRLRINGFIYHLKRIIN